MNILIKSINDKRETRDGIRVLVDDWLPSGLDEHKIKADMWIKDLAPSLRLKGKFGENPRNWDEYEDASIKELDEDKSLLAGMILDRAKGGNITLLYSKGDKDRNNAIIVRDYILASREEFVPLWVEKSEEMAKVAVGKKTIKKAA